MFPPAELVELFLAVFDNLCYAFLVSAGLFLAVLTVEAGVGVLRESLGVESEEDLPDEEENQ